MTERAIAEHSGIYPFFNAVPFTLNCRLQLWQGSRQVCTLAHHFMNQGV